jgi:recombinational DNA repair protein RecR
MKLKKCPNCKSYTLKEICKKCNEKTKDAHYKFLRLKDAPKSDTSIVRRK